jgi:predicted membrane chloride channel (bestrophin family)
MLPRSHLVFDTDKEPYREHRRVVFDFDYWANDRSTSRLFFNLLDIPTTRILRSVIAPTLFVTFVAAFRASPVFKAIPYVPGVFKACATPIALSASFLAVATVFRTNNAYSRFDEARKVLGKTLNRTRDIVRLVIGTFPAAAVQAKATFARWVIVTFYALQCHLRRDDDLDNEIMGLLTEVESEQLRNHSNKVRVCPS